MFGVTNPGEESFKDGVWGHDGSVWRKLPLLWGFSGRWAETVVGTSVGDPATNAVTTAVPAGFVYVLEQWMCLQVDTAARSSHLTLAGADGAPYLYENVALAQDTYVYGPCRITLEEGDQLQFTVWGLVATKKCHLWVWGHMMRVT